MEFQVDDIVKVIGGKFRLDEEGRVMSVNVGYEYVIVEMISDKQWRYFYPKDLLITSVYLDFRNRW